MKLERREFKRKNNAREKKIARELRIEADAFAFSWRRYAVAAASISFALNDVVITDTFSRLYNCYTACATPDDNFFVFTY